MFTPSESTLKRLQITSHTYVENDFFVATWAGICRWTRLYSFYYFFSMTYGVASATGFLFGVSTVDDWEKFLENVHFIPLVVNMATQAAAYHYSQREYLELIWAIDRGFFDYEGSLDEGTKLEITAIKSKAKNRKKVFGHYYTILLGTTSVLQLLKKPVTYILKGGGMNAMDGENNLIWEAPFGMYVPYAEHWFPYLLGMFFGYSAAQFVLITGLGSVLQYQYISEELLAEFSVVKKTFTKCVERAEMMFQTRMVNVFKKLMYFPLFAVIFDGGLVLCISSYILINNDLSMTFRIPMPCVIAVEAILALIFCYYGGRLTEAHEDVGNGVYDCEGWIDHSETLRPYALIVKGYCNIPNELTAAGFTDVNRRTFGNLLSAAYSYIGFMLST